MPIENEKAQNTGARFHFVCLISTSLKHLYAVLKDAYAVRVVPRSSNIAFSPNPVVEISLYAIRPRFTPMGDYMFEMPLCCTLAALLLVKFSPRTSLPYLEVTGPEESLTASSSYHVDVFDHFYNKLQTETPSHNASRPALFLFLLRGEPVKNLLKRDLAERILANAKVCGIVLFKEERNGWVCLCVYLMIWQRCIDAVP